MPINIPTSSATVKSRLRANIQSLMSFANPFLKGSWLGALADSFAERVYDFYLSLQQSIDEVFPDTTLDNLDRWGSFYGISQNAATSSSGQAVFYFNGVPDPILDGAILTDVNGNEYTVVGNYPWAPAYITQSSLTRSSTTATFTSSTPHSLRTGDGAFISGASDSGFNGSKIVTVVSPTVFTYTVSSGIGASATGAYFVRSNLEINIKSTQYGLNKNLAAYSLVNLQNAVAGFYSEGFITYEGLTGGQDPESVSAFRARLLDLIRNPIAHFNVADITRIAKTINGVTRVFVQEVTPAAGQTTIYFMVDNETDPVPNSAKISEVKNKILTIKPANTSDADVIVAGPTKVTQNFVFTALTPNTSTMRDSVLQSLKQFFSETPQIGVSVVADAYRAAIFSTIDLTTGSQVSSFTLSSPSGTITVAAGQIAVLGTVTFP